LTGNYRVCYTTPTKVGNGELACNEYNVCVSNLIISMFALTTRFEKLHLLRIGNTTHDFKVFGLWFPYEYFKLTSGLSLTP